ncbi:uncharacterized protein LOC119180718 isoform X1 [Rhipicephalus microplus]|uniref:uncharacterized protein LOC119180718 isoform X1 n=1 Tax=Rhipicephalus microplus TaxID=6941 RepID=UPI003F6B5842
MIGGHVAGAIFSVLMLCGISESSVDTYETDVANIMKKNFPDWEVTGNNTIAACVYDILKPCVANYTPLYCQGEVRRFSAYCKSYAYTTQREVDFKHIFKTYSRCRSCLDDFKNRADAFLNGIYIYSETEAIMRDYFHFVSVASSESDFNGMCQALQRVGCISCNSHTGEISQDYSYMEYLPNNQNSRIASTLKIFADNTFDFFRRDDKQHSSGQYGHYILVENTGGCFIVQRIIDGEPKWKRAYASSSLNENKKKACAKRIEENGMVYYMCKP